MQAYAPDETHRHFGVYLFGGIVSASKVAKLMAIPAVVILTLGASSCEVDTTTSPTPVPSPTPIATPTQAPPPAEPAPAQPAPDQNCTPGYSPCLTPMADYDCEGGSGNGPGYTGRVSVTGSDPYGLDRDGDGVGCE